jgi:hypothetical protein
MAELIGSTTASARTASAVGMACSGAASATGTAGSAGSAGSAGGTGGGALPGALLGAVVAGTPARSDLHCSQNSAPSSFSKWQNGQRTMFNLRIVR